VLVDYAPAEKTGLLKNSASRPPPPAAHPASAILVAVRGVSYSVRASFNSAVGSPPRTMMDCIPAVQNMRVLQHTRAVERHTPAQQHIPAAQ
jgi:hypothetical protein